MIERHGLVDPPLGHHGEAHGVGEGEVLIAVGFEPGANRFDFEIGGAVNDDVR
jgi:hypothetical protein